MGMAMVLTANFLTPIQTLLQNLGSKQPVKVANPYLLGFAWCYFFAKNFWDGFLMRNIYKVVPKKTAINGDITPFNGRK